MAITAAMVKELREMTGVGMLECKKALQEVDGDMEKAVEYLREKGLAASAKKAARIAAEGIVAAHINQEGNIGCLVEVNSESDFVAKNAVFQEYVAQVAEQVVDCGAANLEELMGQTWKFDTSVTVEQALSQKIAVIGEKLSIRRFEKFALGQPGVLVSYIHGGGRIGVLLEVACDNPTAEVAEMAKNICMQIAALKPEFIATEDVSEEFKAKEMEILTQQAMNDPKNAGKKPEIIQKMIGGRLNKELKEFCLLEQPYVKETDMTVKAYIQSIAKAVNAPIKLVRFSRYETGEGLAKKEENYAEEVAKLMN